MHESTPILAYPRHPHSDITLSSKRGSTEHSRQTARALGNAEQLTGQFVKLSFRRRGFKINSLRTAQRDQW